MLEQIINDNPESTFLKADGFDEAIIGLDEGTMRLIYSVSKSIDILVADGMEYEVAVEYFWYNVAGSYVGDQTPIWCSDSY